MRARVRLVPVLERHEEARIALGELERETDGAVRALRAGREDDLGAVEAQQPHALLGRVLRHHARERVALELRHERERDARVPARRLEQLAAGLELAGRLGGLDHRLRDAVLDRAGRVLALELRVEPDAVLRRQPRQLDERGVADEVEQGARGSSARPAGHRRQEDRASRPRARACRGRRACACPRRRRRRSRTRRRRRSRRSARRAPGSARRGPRARRGRSRRRPRPGARRPTRSRSVGGMRTTLTPHVLGPAQNST